MDNLLTDAYGYACHCGDDFDATAKLVLLPVAHFLELFPTEKESLKKLKNESLLESNEPIAKAIDSVVYCESCKTICGLIYAYQIKHYPLGQPRVDGIIVDPILRLGFDTDEIELRPRSEVLDWWRVPYIETVEYKSRDETYQDYVFRMRNFGLPDSNLQSPDAWVENEAEDKARFYRQNPSGKYYIVKMLDGGSRDRPTEYAKAGSLQSAIGFVKDRLLASDGDEVFPGQYLS